MSCESSYNSIQSTVLGYIIQQQLVLFVALLQCICILQVRDGWEAMDAWGKQVLHTRTVLKTSREEKDNLIEHCG
jgi:hypothetical protein